jgi:hypothetical protein
MNLRTLCIRLSVMAAVVLPVTAFGKAGMSYGGGGAAGPKPIPIDQPLKFVSTGEAIYNGHKDTYVILAPITGSGTIQAWAPYKDKTTEPDVSKIGPVTTYKPGDVLRAELDKMNTTFVIKQLKLLDVAEGEDTPHGYVFKETYSEQGTSLPLVSLSKYGQILEAGLPRVKDAKGQMVTDPQMEDSISKFKAGQVVYVQLAPGGTHPILTGIYPYKTPDEGKVTKVSEQMIDNQKAPDVELTSSDGKAITALVPGKTVNKKWVPDVIVLREVRALRPGTAVLYMTYADNDKTYLIDISKAPPAPKADKEKTTMAK